MKTDGTTSRRAFLRTSAVVAAGAPVIAASLEGCLLDSSGLARGHPPTITGRDADVDGAPDYIDPVETDAGVTDAGDSDVTDSGSCADGVRSYATRLMSVYVWSGNLDEQRIRESGLTFRQIFDSALTSGTAYETIDYRMLTEREDVKDAFYADLRERAREAFGCASVSEADIILERALNELVGTAGTESLYQPVTNDGENAIYFARVRGNDDLIRTYGVFLGALTEDREQPAEPVVLYFTPMDNTLTLLEEIEGGI